MVTVEGEVPAHLLLPINCSPSLEKHRTRWCSPLLSTRVLTVMLLQQVIRWPVESQAFVLFLEAIPGAKGTH